jgi:hypothetical protein
MHDKHLCQLGTHDYCLLLQVAGRVQEEESPFPQEFDINPQVPLVGEKHPCCITLRLESQEVEI